MWISGLFFVDYRASFGKARSYLLPIARIKVLSGRAREGPFLERPPLERIPPLLREAGDQSLADGLSEQILIVGGVEQAILVGVGKIAHLEQHAGHG